MDDPYVHPFQDQVLQTHINNTRNVEGTAADETFGVNTHKVGLNFHCPSNIFYSDLYEFIMDLKREAGTDLVSDPIVILNKIYATSVLAKYSSTKYQHCPQIKNVL